MKTLNISDSLHKALRLKAIHTNQKIGEVVDVILSQHLNTTETPTGMK